MFPCYMYIYIRIMNGGSFVYYKRSVNGHVKCLRGILYMYMNMCIRVLSISVITIVYACDTIKVLTTKIDATSHNM